MNRLVRALSAAAAACALSSPSAIAQQAAATPACMSFSAAINAASGTSPDAQIRLAERDEAMARLEELRSLGRPQLSAFGRSLAGDSDLSDARISNQAGLRLSQDLFDFSKRRLRERAARSDLQSAAEQVEAARELSALEAGGAYLEILQATERSGALAKERDAMRLLADALSDLSASRDATADDVLETRSRLSTLEAEISRLELAKGQSLAALRLLTSTPSAVPCGLAGIDVEWGGAYRQLASSDAAIADAIARHPRIRAASHAIEARNIDMDYERRSWLPTLRGVGTLAYGQDDEDSKWRTRDSLGVEFSMPIISSGGQGAREDAATARRLQAIRLRDQAALELEQEIRFALQSYTIGEAQLVQRRLAADQKRQQLDLVEGAYDDGLRTLRDLVEVQSELTAQEQARIANEFDVMAAGLRLNLLARTGDR
jgi:outer membrane protein TolC